MRKKFGLYYHDTGTGKTCLSIDICIHAIGIYPMAIIVIPNQNLLRQFQENLLEKCNIGRTNVEKISENQFKLIKNRKNSLTLIIDTVNNLIKPNTYTNNTAKNVIICFDEAHKIKCLNFTISLEKIASSETCVNIASFKNKFKIKESFALTATPMLDSPQDLINILSSMAFLCGISTQNIFNIRAFNKTAQNNSDEFSTKFRDIMVEFQKKGALFSRRKVNTRSNNFPTADLSQCFFNTYSNNTSNPIKVALSRNNMQRAEALNGGKNVTIDTFYKTQFKLSWRKMEQASFICNSAKLSKIKDLVNDFVTKSPILIYSKWVNAGVELVSKYLQNEFPQFVTETLTSDKSAAQFKEIKEKYNSPENHNGSMTQFLVISGVAATGHDFRNTQLMILLEPDVNPGTLVQAIGRVIRINIFDKKPGHTKIVGLLCESPDKKKMTIDEQLYHLMMMKFKYMKLANTIFSEQVNVNVALSPTVSFQNELNLNSKIAQLSKTHHLNIQTTQMLSKRISEISNANLKNSLMQSYNQLQKNHFARNISLLTNIFQKIKQFNKQRQRKQKQPIIPIKPKTILPRTYKKL